MTKQSVLCLATSRIQAEYTVDRLKDSGFSTDDISVLLPEKKRTHDFVHEKFTNAPEGTVAGAGGVGVVGGTLGRLGGIGLLAVPSIGPFLAAGPIMATLSGVGVGATVGGVAGGLVDLGIPEYQAKRYEGKIKGGGILISVQADSSNEIGRAKMVFEAAGAKDIASTGEASVPSTSAASPTGVLGYGEPTMAGSTTKQFQVRPLAALVPVR